jgi:hypothetical protein
VADFCSPFEADVRAGVFTEQIHDAGVDLQVRIVVYARDT